VLKLKKKVVSCKSVVACNDLYYTILPTDYNEIHPSIASWLRARRCPISPHFLTRRFFCTHSIDHSLLLMVNFLALVPDVVFPEARAYFKQSLQLHREQTISDLTFLKNNFFVYRNF